MNLKHLIRKRVVTNKTWYHGKDGIYKCWPIQNPKYGKLEYSDPREDEQWEQSYILMEDVIRELFNRIEKLEKNNVR